MRQLAFAAALLSISSVSFAGVYGKFIDEKKAPEPLAKLLASGSKDQTVVTEGKVEKVCEKKGCWLTLEDQGKSVRVFFKGYSFFVGKDLVGKKVKAEGVLHKKTQTVAEQKHYLEDGGASKAEIDKITAPLDTYTFEANAVATL